MKRKKLVLSMWAVIAAMSMGTTTQVYAKVGEEQWRSHEDSGTNGGYDKNDFGYEVAFDSQGNVVTVGSVDSSQSGTAANDNAYVVKYNATGTKLWDHEYDDGDVEGTNCNFYKCDSTDRLYTVAVDSADNIIVGGAWSGKYASENYHQAHWVRSMTADGNTANWEYLWYQGPWNNCFDLALSDSEDIYTAGKAFRSFNTNEGDWVLFHYSSTGTVDPNYPYFVNVGQNYWLEDHGYGAAVDGNGYHYAVGRIGVSGTLGGSTNDFDWHVRKFDPADGTVLWSDTLDENHLYDQARKVIVDANNDVYVVGQLNRGTDNSTNQDYDWVVIKYDGDGDGAGGAVRLWTHRVTGPAGKTAAAHDIAWDNVTNTVVVVGYVANETTGVNEGRMERLDPATGNVIREQMFPSTNGLVPVGVALQGDNIAISGYEGNGSDWDVTTIYLNAIRAGLTLTPDTGLTTTEAGGTATVQVRLASAPEQDVTVNLTSSNVGEGTVSPASLTFTPANWDIPQTITLTGVEDSVDDGDQAYTIQFAVSSTDLLYDGLAVPDLTVTNQDNDPMFADVPIGYWAYDGIQSLADSGITSGCGDDKYCPTDEVTRAQMAVFLERGIHGTSFIPPAATGTVFDDVPTTYWAADWIEALAADSITSGCGGGNYCPDASVNRGQMAVFLLKSKHGSDYVPPAATGTLFDDVPASFWSASWIEQLANEGITMGCDPDNYCPNDPVTRDSMAIFLTRTFDL